MTVVNNHSIELLAPAGCYPSLQAAIAAGADSVYFGLAQLNMRARARRSFQGGDLPGIMERLHRADRKGFLTLNTLVYDHDLRLMNALLDEAVKEGVDAVIVADVAAVMAARERNLEVHISTQLSVSNYPAVVFFSQWADRIVLARELTLGAIERIHKNIVENDLRGPSGRLMELEAFAHGAQCVAVSGRCGMSVYTSNASANRGACEQNCRKEYTITDRETGKELVVDNNYIMSPTDLCTLGFLDKVVGAGITVLKLEGRARSPEYVQSIVDAYRSAVDALADGSYGPDLVNRLMPQISEVYNRGIGSGFYFGRDTTWSETGGSKATHKKELVGRILKYYAKPGVVVARVEASELRDGETFLIVGPTTGVIKGVVENLHVDGEPNPDGVKGAEISFKVPTRVRLSDRLFKMVPVG